MEINRRENNENYNFREEMNIVSSAILPFIGGTGLSYFLLSYSQVAESSSHYVDYYSGTHEFFSLVAGVVIWAVSVGSSVNYGDQTAKKLKSKRNKPNS